MVRWNGNFHAPEKSSRFLGRDEKKKSPAKKTWIAVSWNHNYHKDATADCIEKQGRKINIVPRAAEATPCRSSVHNNRRIIYYRGNPTLWTSIDPPCFYPATRTVEVSSSDWMSTEDMPSAAFIDSFLQTPWSFNSTSPSYLIILTLTANQSIISTQ